MFPQTWRHPSYAFVHDIPDTHNTNIRQRPKALTHPYLIMYFIFSKTEKILFFNCWSNAVETGTRDRPVLINNLCYRNLSGTVQCRSVNMTVINNYIVLAVRASNVSGFEWNGGYCSQADMGWAVASEDGRWCCRLHYGLMHRAPCTTLLSMPL